MPVTMTNLSPLALMTVDPYCCMVVVQNQHTFKTRYLRSGGASYIMYISMYICGIIVC